MSETKIPFSVEFANTIEDYAILGRYQYDKKRFSLKGKIAYMIFYPVFFVAIYFVIINFILDKSYFQFNLFFSAILYLVLLPVSWFRVKFLQKEAEKSINEPRSKFQIKIFTLATRKRQELFAKKSLTFFDSSIEAKFNDQVVIRKYTDFDSYDEILDYLFLNLKIEKSSIVYPKKYFTPEQIDFIKSKASEANIK